MEEMKEMNTKTGITGSTLKIIAMVCMLIDHIGAVILERYLYANGLSYKTMQMMVEGGFGNLQKVVIADLILRLIGRLAFPIFCFLLVEGFYYTSNRAKYVLRLFLFALISEVPFDFAFKNSWLEFRYQNVFFTLTIGLLTIWGIDEIQKRICERSEDQKKHAMSCSLIRLLGIIIGGVVAAMLSTDYAWVGVATIGLMYIFREKSKNWEMGMGCLMLIASSPLEVSSFINLALVGHYNGQRGLRLKYVFYVFFPLHLLILGLICRLIGV